MKLGIPTRERTNPILLSWSDIISIIPGMILLSLGSTFLLTYKGKISKLRCLKCEKEKWDDGKIDCECGGTFCPVDDIVYEIDDNISGS